MILKTKTIKFKVKLMAVTQADLDEAFALVEARMARVVEGEEIRVPMHPLAHHRHGTQLAVIVK